MCRIIGLLLTVFLFGCSDDASQDQTSFGYSIDVPDNWIVLSQKEIRENPELFDGLTLDGVSPELMEGFKKRIERGVVEMYFRQNDAISSFCDNINVIKQIQTLPTSPEEIQKLRSTLPGELEKLCGRRLEIYECKLTRVAGRNALFLDFEGVVSPTRSLQYQIEKSGSVSLIFTATCNLATFDEVRAEFESMINSIEINME